MNRRTPPKTPCTVVKYSPEGTVVSEETIVPKTHHRGPKTEGSNSRKSLRTMTEDDAKRVVHGDLKDVSHGQAASALGLSYGQVYSARGGYTFKHVKA